VKPVVGHTYQLAEPDYRFGAGPILITVTHVVGQTDYDNESWWTVHGRSATGTAEGHGGWQHREFLDVRSRNLRSARVTVADAN
jgi:hypothetical protein